MAKIISGFYIFMPELLLINNCRSLNLAFVFFTLPDDILSHKFYRHSVINRVRRMMYSFGLNLSATRRRSMQNVCSEGFRILQVRATFTASACCRTLKRGSTGHKGLLNDLWWYGHSGDIGLREPYWKPHPKVHYLRKLAFQPRRFITESLYLIIRMIEVNRVDEIKIP